MGGARELRHLLSRRGRTISRKQLSLGIARMRLLQDQGNGGPSAAAPARLSRSIASRGAALYAHTQQLGSDPPSSGTVDVYA